MTLDFTLSKFRSLCSAVAQYYPTPTLAESGKYDYIITDDVKALPYIKSVAMMKVLTYGGVLETVSYRYFDDAVDKS